MNHGLAKRLLAMERADQAMRRAAVSGVAVWDTELDRAHTSELKRVIKKHGWPTVSLVGERAVHAAWIIAQHADHDPVFQRMILRLMHDTGQVMSDEVLWNDIAYLTDRILVHHDKCAQWFGTQHYFTAKGKLVPFPIQDKRNVNRRRLAFGLETQAQNTRRLNAEWRRLRKQK